MSRRALSLPEVLVTVALTGIAASLTFLIFHRVFRAAGRGVERSTSTQEAVSWYRRFLRDLESGTSFSLTWATNLGPEQQKVAAIQPVESVTTLARPVYSTRKVILYRYFPGGRLLWRQSFENGATGLTLDPDTPQRLTPNGLLALQTSTQGQVARLERVIQWDLGSSLTAPLVSRHLRPQLALTLLNAQGAEVRFELKRDFMLPICP